MPVTIGGGHFNLGMMVLEALQRRRAQALEEQKYADSWQQAKQARRDALKEISDRMMAQEAQRQFQVQQTAWQMAEERRRAEVEAAERRAMFEQEQAAQQPQVAEQARLREAAKREREEEKAHQRERETAGDRWKAYETQRDELVLAKAAAEKRAEIHKRDSENPGMTPSNREGHAAWAARENANAEALQKQIEELQKQRPDLVPVTEPAVPEAPAPQVPGRAPLAGEPGYPTFRERMEKQYPPAAPEPLAPEGPSPQPFAPAAAPPAGEPGGFRPELSIAQAAQAAEAKKTQQEEWTRKRAEAEQNAIEAGRLAQFEKRATDLGWTVKQAKEEATRAGFEGYVHPADRAIEQMREAEDPEFEIRALKGKWTEEDKTNPPDEIKGLAESLIENWELELREQMVAKQYTDEQIKQQLARLRPHGERAAYVKALGAYRANLLQNIGRQNVKYVTEGVQKSEPAAPPPETAPVQEPTEQEPAASGVTWALEQGTPAAQSQLYEKALRKSGPILKKSTLDRATLKYVEGFDPEAIGWVTADDPLGEKYRADARVALRKQGYTERQAREAEQAWFAENKLTPIRPLPAALPRDRATKTQRDAQDALALLKGSQFLYRDYGQLAEMDRGRKALARYAGGEPLDARALRDLADMLGTSQEVPTPLETILAQTAEGSDITETVIQQMMNVTGLRPAPYTKSGRLQTLNRRSSQQTASARRIIAALVQWASSQSQARG